VSLLIDLFGYFSVVIRGLTITAQSISLGSVLFIALLLRPLMPQLGASGDKIERSCIAIAAWSALALVVCEAATITLQSAVLVGTVDLSLVDTLRAGFAIAGVVKASAAALIALTLFAFGRRAALGPLLALSAIILAAATLTTHAAARLLERTPLLLVECLHQFAAAIWIGGIPCFLVTLGRVQSPQAWRAVGARFSRMSMVGVACIVLSGLAMSFGYIGSWEADGRCQDRNVPDAAGTRCRQLPAG
jgi:copper resistance protein D